ncbi:MAG TPA: leucyl aminopeptidase [Bacteroidales bacterium]|nr:leucyl aminopeptidase [Bacteroidales bacterium]HPS16151.1 leucyl aminopeptidase [Bacteroidales bacterium]
MFKNIEKTEKYSVAVNAIFLAEKPESLAKYSFTKDEITYMSSLLSKNETKTFSFNRLKKWDFVVFPDNKKQGYDVKEYYRKTADSLLPKINSQKISKIQIVDISEKTENTIAFIEGLVLGNYQFTKYKKGVCSKKTIHTLENISVFSKKVNAANISEINIILKSVYISRDLVNEPVSYLNAAKLADEALKVCKSAGAKVEVLNKKQIETLKMGGLLAVNKGSIDPPTFTIIEWKPAKPVNKKPYVFVGKGLVIDTGGICLKPWQSMETMKCDMSGAAAVIGAIHAIASAKLPVHVYGLIPSTDNRPGGNCFVPGDIITMHDGTTVEVLNTDAEGRLILADALSYAKKLNPGLVIDMATLTGSAHAAVGKYAMVGMGKDHGMFMKKLMDSGNAVCERIVEFPMWDDYKELLKSEIADMKNIGGAYAGAITAAKFLEHFTDYPWIHLDIAGPAFMDNRYTYLGQGGTGYCVRLLFDFMKNISKK